MIHGNLLKEKTLDLPVVIVEEKYLLSFLKDIRDTKIIPYSSLGNEGGVLIGFLPDNMKIYLNDDCFEKKAVIGIYEGKICESSNEYHAIIGGEI